VLSLLELGCCQIMVSPVTYITGIADLPIYAPEYSRASVRKPGLNIYPCE
jgi:hypothetical protein